MKKIIKNLILASALTSASSIVNAAGIAEDVPPPPTTSTIETHSFHTEALQEDHPYGKVLILQNLTGKSLDSYRVLALFKIDEALEFTPDNTTTLILRFADSDDAVALPITNLSFSCAIYKGGFSDDAADADVLRTGELVFTFHGNEFGAESKRVHLTTSAVNTDDDDVIN